MEEVSKTVFVGVSGGVDSSLALYLLKEQGYKVVGVFIRTWTPDFIECTWKDERRDAMRVCAHLDVPFLECDAEEEYKKGVADYMIEEYRKGNTPNPDVMCNREVKFGVFWQFAKSKGADYIATGHYARNEHKDNTYYLKKGVDDSKDQSYFLWTLTQDDLSHALFPVGHLKKSEVRKLAEKYNLPTATKKDSQGVCFLGPLDMKDFLSHYIKAEKGNVLNEKGEIIGTHNGALFFTLGERHGFTLTKNNNEPLYIVKKDIKNNTITVSGDRYFKDTGESINSVSIDRMNWISVKPDSLQTYESQIRYHGEYLNSKVQVDEGKVLFEKSVLVDKGQSVVFYDKDICLGGGIIV